MKRGIISFTKEELLELVKYYKIDTDSTCQAQIKFQSAIDTIDEQNDISVSDEELECILDEIGIVDNSNPILKSAVDKISQTLVQFRNPHY